MQTIGIIGQGFVGTAVREGLRHAHSILTYDKKEPLTVGHYNTNGGSGRVAHSTPFEYLVFNSDPIFVCLPTPMLPSGECSLDIVCFVVEKINGLCMENDCRRVVAIKSTIPPGTTDSFNDDGIEDGVGASVCFQPEFLTEAHAIEDFKNQKYIVCGGREDAVDMVRSVYAKAYPDAKFFGMTAVEAELVKYFTNCGLACRVSLANEFAQICEKLGVDYNKVIGVAKENTLGKDDTRMGLTHWDVPGHDCIAGFGGSCFCKDLNALIHVAKKLGVKPTCMEAAWEKNLEVRPGRDWEQLKGRAVVE